MKHKIKIIAVLIAVVMVAGLIPESILADDAFSFTTYDIVYNNEYTEEVFHSKPLTVVYVWAVWCGPAVSELPTIMQVESHYSSQVQFLSILFYQSENYDDINTAKNIINNLGFDIPVLRSNNSVKTAFADYLTGGFPVVMIFDYHSELKYVTRGSHSYDEWCNMIDDLLPPYQENVSVTFLDWDNTVLSQQTIPYGGNAIPPQNPERNGYVFIGWDHDLSFIFEDLSIYALYQEEGTEVDPTFTPTPAPTNYPGSTPEPSEPDEDFYIPNIDLYGYGKNFDDHNWFTFNTSSISELLYLLPDDGDYTCGAYTGSKLYAITSDKQLISFDAEDITSWTNKKSIGVINVSYTINEMAYDMCTDTLYIIVGLADVYSINVETAEVTFVCNSNYGISAISFDREGICYIVDAYGYLCTLDITTGNQTSEIGYYGVVPYSGGQFIVQCGIYAAGFFFWEAADSSITSYNQIHLLAIDLSTGDFVDLGSISNDVYALCLFTPESFSDPTVTFLDWDGTVLSQQTIPYGSSAEAPSDPVRNGYTFIGWDKEFINVRYSIIVKAVYSINHYSISYVGAYTGTDTVEFGSNAVLPVLEAEGVHYTFTVDGEPWDGTNITSDVTVTVGMAIDVYTVEFYDPIGEEVINSQQVEYYQAAEAPEAPLHEHYAFTGWDKTFDHVTSDIRVNAVYIPETYTVIFTDGFYHVISTQTVAYHSAASEPPIPEVSGYTFVGWDADFSCIEHDLTVNAIWERTYCTVNFVGVYTATVVVEYGADCELPELDSPSIHYTFTVDGAPWDGTNIISDVTVTVGVAPNATTFFTVTFLDWDGTVLSEQTVSYGSAASAPEAPAREGWVFIGWDKPFDRVTKDLVITAVYEEYTEPGKLVGDANNDGILSSADLSALFAYVMNAGSLSEQGLINSDVNGDGAINTLDVTVLSQLIFGA